ncbi:MAG: ATP-binding domain-containing protein [Alphaproteobacteria bacterium]|nr:ATP-binding domain-containing protein [Alphaproteobacteria bacterium]
MPDSDDVLHDAIARDEETCLERVRRRLEEVPIVAPPSETDLVAELVRLREDVRNAKEEDKPAMMQQYEHQFALLQQLRDARDKPEVDPASPYFAHLRIDEDGQGRDLFLGKATRLDHGLRIVDWRNAPISRIFYSYQQGETFEEPMGGRMMEGTLATRRTVRIDNGVLLRIDAPEGVLVREDRDAAWTIRATERPRLAGGQGASRAQVHAKGQGDRRRLGTDGAGRLQRPDKHLPDIAGLIDPEQFELITRPSSGFVVIRGTAGSGKTTVALHRIAYLAYADARIDSDRTLFLVFSKALRDYVGQVLPALGIRKVRPRTFPEWAADQRRRHFPGLPRTVRDDTPELVTRLKVHPATMVALERQVEAVTAPATMEQALDDWASVLTQPDVLADVLRELAPDALRPHELDKAQRWCRDRHAELLAWLDGDRDDDVEVALDPEDDALLLRAWQLRVGPLRQGTTPLRYLHVAIDEVQDFSPVEVRVLLDCLDTNQSITLAGDTQQHVMANAGFTSWSSFFDWLGVQGEAVETLRVAYRSAEPIVTFAQSVLGELAEDGDPPLTVRTGPPVEVFRFTDDGAAVAFLGDALKALASAEPLANVALITPDAHVAALYHEGLQRAEVPRLRRVTDEDFAFTPGVEVVDVRQVKGLEFDYVVVVEASAAHYPDTPAARRLLHVAATRAIHQLWVTSVGTASPIIRGALADDAALSAS